MQRPGFYFCICPDWELIKDHIENLTQKYNFKAQIKTFWADEGIDDRFWSYFLQRTLFKGSFLLIVRKAELLKKDFWDKLENILNRFYLRTWPFFCIESEWTKDKTPKISGLENKKFWKIANKNKWIWISSGITLGNVVSYFIDIAKKEGIFVSLSDIFSIRDLLPLDGASIKAEVKKLKMYLLSKGKTKATERDILNILSSESFDVFALIKSLEEKDLSKPSVWKDVVNKKDEGILFLIVSLLFREAVVLWSIKTDSPLGLKLSEGVLNKKREIANRLSLEDIVEIMSLLLDIEMGVKSGIITLSQALDFLIAASSLIFSKNV